jgi:hypothetical protein
MLGFLHSANLTKTQFATALLPFRFGACIN